MSICLAYNNFMPSLERNNKQSKYDTSPLLVLTVMMIVLFFGLRPKTWPITNNVHWIPEQKALSFHHPGIAYVDDVHIFNNKQHSGEFTIQIIVAPESVGKPGFRPVLMMHDGDDHSQLTIWHWGTSVIVMNGDDYDYSRKWPRLYAIDALTPGEASFITVTSSNLGTSLFINSILVKKIKNWKLTIPNTGKKLQLILGNSVYGKHSWEGEIYGLALHGKALSPERVKRHYDKWLRQRNFTADSMDELLLLYTFNEYEDEGRLVSDRTGRNQPLQLPFRQVVLKKTFLSSPGHNFTPNQSFFVDAVLNLIAFIPMGAVIYYWSRRSKSLPRRYEAQVIVAFCFFLSLSMEISQAWLPNRTSSWLDLVLNTLGAWLGVLLLDSIQRTRT